MLEGFVSLRPVAHGPPASGVVGRLAEGVAAAWTTPWNVPPLDRAADQWAEPDGGSWLIASGRAWWRDGNAAPVTARDLLRLLLEEGPPALRRIDGCFALAWLDANTGSVWLARDYFGIEPLHYAACTERAVFASRLTRLHRLLEGPARISPHGLRDYLVYGYCPGEQVLMEHVLRVPPGEAVRFKPCSGGLEADTSSWHRLSYRSQPLGDDREIESAFREALQAAVLRRLGAGRPAVMLSGGMDSSAVASLMRQRELGGICAITFRCRGKGFDESEFARRLSSELALEHVQLELTEDHALEFARDLAGMDCPFSDAGIEIGTWLVAKAAAGHADYILTGDGGDELWASHPVYAAQRLVRFYEAAPMGKAARRWVRRLLDLVPDSAHKRDVRVIAKRLLPDPDLPQALRHIRWKVHYDPAGVRGLLGEAPAESSQEELYASVLRAFAGFDGEPGSSDAMLYNDYRTATAFYAARLLLFRRYGVEARVPFFDAELVELGARIPFRKKLEGIERTKRLFRSSMRGIVPNAILDRSSKLGHSVPMKNWLRTPGPLRAELTAVLLEELAGKRALVDRAALEAMLAEHVAGRHNHSHRLWALFVLELWLQQHLDAASALVPAPLGVAEAV